MPRARARRSSSAARADFCSSGVSCRTEAASSADSSSRPSWMESRDELLLRPVVEIALDLAPLLVLRLHQPPPRGPQFLDRGLQLRGEPAVAEDQPGLGGQMLQELVLGLGQWLRSSACAGPARPAVHPRAGRPPPGTRPRRRADRPHRLAGAHPGERIRRARSSPGAAPGRPGSRPRPGWLRWRWPGRSPSSRPPCRSPAARPCRRQSRRAPDRAWRAPRTPAGWRPGGPTAERAGTAGRPRPRRRQSGPGCPAAQRASRCPARSRRTRRSARPRPGRRRRPG